jgi:hypothetical protein
MSLGAYVGEFTALLVRLISTSGLPIFDRLDENFTKAGSGGLFGFNTVWLNI